jgi:hypothetical protein
MKRTRHTPEQIIRKLRDAERLVGSADVVYERRSEGR